MALIIRGKAYMETGATPTGASRFYFSIWTTYLSEAYDLVDGDIIKGEIISVKEKEREYPELTGKEIALILKSSIIFDELYIIKTDWDNLFREWGLVAMGYEVELKLTEATRHLTGESIKLYTKKDVTLG